MNECFPDGHRASQPVVVYKGLDDSDRLSSSLGK